MHEPILTKIKYGFFIKKVLDAQILIEHFKVIFRLSLE